MQNEIRQPMPKLRSVNALISTIGSSTVSTRQKKAIAEIAQTVAQTATDVSCSHSYCGPSSSTYSSEPRNPAIAIRPHQSKWSSSLKFGWSKSTSTSTPTVMPIPGTMLMKNSQCQDMASVMKPPTVGPMVGASVATRPMIGPTMWSFDRGKTVKADANTVGIMPAPRNPWIARQRIICSIVEANPHRKLARVKPEAEMANSNRVPSARDMNPDNGIAITSAIRYEVWTHDTSLELADKPAWISLSDAETIWMSRIDMNIPNTMMRNANSRRGAMRSDGAAAAFIIEGGAVVASAMICSGQDMHLDRARRLIRNIIAGGSSSASRGRLR